MNNFFLYVVGSKFVTVKDLKLGLTSNIDKAAYWIDKDKANTWANTINRKYPKAKLTKAKLTLNN